MASWSSRSRSVGLVAFALLGILNAEVAAQTRPETSSPPTAPARTDAAALLQVSGEVARRLSLSAVEFAKLPRQTVQAKDHDGRESSFEGVPMSELLARAGVPSGKELRGKAVSLYLVVEASDGYRAVFALPELDPAFSDRVILLADRRDGRSVSDHDGPLRVIVPGEKRYARWVRQVIRLKVGRV